DRFAPLYAMGDRNAPDLFENIQMVPVFLSSLEDEDAQVAKVAAKSLRKILERADREFLRNSYATAMESLKEYSLIGRGDSIPKASITDYSRISSIV
ncbi:hypothetical protein PMAYCL1PPCAC_01840, partial [Pristionchus mayeri]